MKTFIPAAILALTLHGLFLVVTPEWTPRRQKPLLQPQPVTMTLTYRAPLKPAVAQINKPKPPPSIPAPVKPNQLKKQTKPAVPKPRPKIRKPEKEQVRPHPAPRKLLSASPSTKPAAFPEKEASRETPAINDKPASRDIRAVGPKTIHGGQDLQGGRNLAPDPAPPPLVAAIPVYKENPAPRYPRTAKRRGYEGTVLLEALVSREGKVEKIRIFRSSGYSVLDKAAQSSVKEWVFEPGKRGNENIEMWVKIPVRFRLK